MRIRKSAEGGKPCFQPFHRRLAVCECEFIGGEDYQHHENGAEQTMREYPVKLIRKIEPVGFVALFDDPLL